MSDLLKEAIADAKAVRETALANAKMALEEAFTPHLKSMLSAKLAEDDMEDEDDDAVVDIDIDADDEEEVEAEEGYGKNYREEDDEEMDMGDDEEVEVDESEIVEIDGVKYAPIVSEEDEEEPVEDEEDEEDMGEELDLEAVIKELEEELEEAGDPGEEEESVNEVDEDDSETVEEEVVAEEEATEEETVDEEVVNEEDDSEELDEYSGTRVEKRKKSGNAPRINNEEVDKLSAELKEYKEAVTFLRDKLHEVNILNAKLLYTNKLFKEYVLSNDQKLKIVETFDRAQTTREIKLVYSTLAESYKDNGGDRKEVVKESYASKKSGGTAPKTKIITEESQVADRFRKLAGLKS
jgi:hypothetical protein